jgi:hypothetical protein
MKITFRLVAAIIFAVGCILQGISFYLLYINWFYEDADSLYNLSNLSIISTLAWGTGLIWLSDKNIKENKCPKKVLGLYALGFALVVLGLSINFVLVNFWLFSLLVISGIATYIIVLVYGESHPEKFKNKTHLTLQN